MKWIILVLVVAINIVSLFTRKLSIDAIYIGSSVILAAEYIECAINSKS